MSEQHTPTPWYVENSDFGARIMAKTAPMSRATVAEITHDDNDARRIVAAVNAVEGISTEALESLADTKFLAMAHEGCLSVKQQRDQLLAALKRIAAEKPCLMHDSDQHELLCYNNGFNPCKEAREAIEAVEGKG